MSGKKRDPSLWKVRAPRAPMPDMLLKDPVRASLSIIGLAITKGNLETAQALLDHYLADTSETGMMARYDLAVGELQRRLTKAQARRAAGKLSRER